MNEIYETIPELIDVLGGNAKVARAIGVKPNTVTAWKRNGSIRVLYWADLMSFASVQKLKPKLTQSKLHSLHDLERIDP